MSKNKKHASGRPLKYKTDADLQTAIDEYFAYCDNKTKEMHSEKLGDMVVPDPEPYTVAGLAYHLGFEDRRSFLDYGGREEFSRTIKKARFKIEQDLERRMMGKDTFTPGLIFNAKNNFGYKDKIESDITSGGKEIGVAVSAAQAEQLIRARAARSPANS